MYTYFARNQLMKNQTEACSEPYQVSKIERFVKIVNG